MSNPYPIIPSAAAGGTFTPGNYNITYVNGALTVTPAPLTIAADNKNRYANTQNPPFTATYSAFPPGETPSALGGELVMTTTATTASLPGRYSIVPSGQSSINYAIDYVNGTLSVIQPAPMLEGFSSLQYGDVLRLVHDDANDESFACTIADDGIVATRPVLAHLRRICGRNARGLIVDLPRTPLNQTKRFADSK